MSSEESAILLIVVYAVAAAWAPAYWAITIPMASFLTMALIKLARGARLFRSWPAGAGLCMAAIGGIQLVGGTTVYAFSTELGTMAWVACAAVAWLASRCDAERMLAPLGYFAGILATLAILVRLTSPFHAFWIFPVGYRNVFGPYVYRNHYAAFAELMVPLALYLVSTRPRRRAVFLLVAATLFAGVAVAESRAGIVLVTFEIATFLAVAGARGILPIRVAGVIVLSVALAIGLAGIGGLSARFREENPYQVRAEITKSSLDMWRARPAVGWGLGTWRSVYPSYARIDPGVLVNEAHNDWVQWASDGGFPAELVMSGLALWCALRGFRCLWGIGVAAVFAHALVDYPFQEPSIVFLAMVLAGLMAARGGAKKPGPYLAQAC